MKVLHVLAPVWIGVLALISGCASYTTPGGAVDLSGIDSEEIRDLMAREAAATFPAVLAFARVQSSNYRSYSADTYGAGAYSVVTTREFLNDAEGEAVAGWPQVRSVTPLSRLLLPRQLDGIRDLRTASAKLKADILLIFTIDTAFRVDGKSIGPLSVVSLGILRDRETVVTSTASAILIDVRSGYVYGVAESTSSESQRTSIWGSSTAVDQSRLTTEREAFNGLLGELEKTWNGVIAEYGGSAD